MKFKEYLDEQKQVGTIYHFTTGKSFRKMLDNNFRDKYNLELFELFSKNDHLSCTRNFCLADDPLGDISVTFGYNVRINIDGTKLSNKYKIRPILGLTNNENPFDIKNKDAERVNRSNAENEEIITSKTKTFKIKDFITSITISGDDKLYNSVKESVEKLGYSIEYQRKFKPLKEDINYMENMKESNIIGVSDEI